MYISNRVYFLMFFFIRMLKKKTATKSIKLCLCDVSGNDSPFGLYIIHSFGDDWHDIIYF